LAAGAATGAGFAGAGRFGSSAFAGFLGGGAGFLLDAAGRTAPLAAGVRLLSTDGRAVFRWEREGSVGRRRAAACFAVGVLAMQSLP
jgi:hypothetical protein